MNSSLPYQEWTVPVFADESCTRFIGTGFLISDNHVLTCEHVMKEGGGWLKPPSGNPSIGLGDKKTELTLDIVLATLNSRFPISSRAVLVQGVDERIVTDLLSSNCIAWGYDPAKDYKLGAISSDTSSSSKKLQFIGSPEKGHSGSPVLLADYPNYGVFGMMFLGGEYAGQSRIIRSDAIIEWLRNLNRPELVPKTVSIDEVLRRIAFGDRDWSSVVRNQWLNMWGYARNKNGEYVGRDGVTPLKDNEGLPIVVFNEQTEEIVRDQGLNTGSIEYAELYDAAPDRFGASETDEEIVQAARERMGIEDRS